MSELAIIVRTDPAPDGAADLGLVGPITHTTAPALRDAVRAVMHISSPGESPHVRLDLACCTKIDLDGLLALAVSQQTARAHGGDLYLDHVPPLVERQVRQHHFDSLLRDHDVSELSDR